MAPIPLTLIGILPGHALLGRQFTATSMIGMIALAGIIVRNSILLVDFIRHEVRGGSTLSDAVVNAGAVRTRPIALTGIAAMAGAFFILDDPIFSGLAVSLIFGILVSTLLTLIVIPVVYYAYRYRKYESESEPA
jgi:multidrug efflux pump subunit AcrB